MKKIFFLLSCLLLFSCGRFSNDDKKENNSERIVVISKQYCELIYALHAEENVVAVDLSSTYPPKAKELPTVGYHRALSLEGIIAAKPSVIMHSGFKTLGPEHLVKQLQSMNVPMKEFSNKGESIESTKSLIREMGTYFKREKEADSLCAKLDADMQLAFDKAKTIQDTPKVLVIHFGRASNTYLVMGKKGTASKMIEWAGGKMAITDTAGMKQISPEVVTESDPDVIIVTDFGYDRLGSIDKIKQLPGVAITRAAKNNKIFRFEEHDLVYIGPRTGENTIKLQTLLHDNK